MKHKVEQITERIKKSHRNTYLWKDTVFPFVFWTIVAVQLITLLWVPLHSVSIPIKLILAVIIIALCLVNGISSFIRQRKKLAAYQRQDVYNISTDAFEFIGLHNLSNIRNPSECRDILPRNEEIAHIKHVLETIIFPQSDIKQLLCLTGKSGCGKSTILSFFRNAHTDDYAFFDFSGDYNYLEAKMESLFGSNPSQMIAQLTHENKKVIIILDQFERYFFLTSEKKANVKEMITRLGRRNAAVIVSMREEYLADFLKEFDINNSQASEEDVLAKAVGLLKPLVSIVRESSCSYYMQASHNASKTIRWKDANIKNNIFPHLQREAMPSNQISERLGVTLFYVENQNESVRRRNDVFSKSLALKGRCERAFGAEGTAFFDKHKHEPLIAQQIIYHMAEYDKKIRGFSDEDMKSIYEMEHQELMARYFDIQLTASENQFDSARILYILSKARLHQITMKTTELKAALFTYQFHSFGERMFTKALYSLEEFQLIHRHTENSTEEYEIAHDFIAIEFLNYSNSNMDFNVRCALDTFMSEYLNHKTSVSEMPVMNHENRISKDRYYKTGNYIALGLLIVIDFIYRFIYNPWTTIPTLIQVNPYGDYFPLFTLTGTWVAILYLGQVYDKIIKYYQGPKRKLCRTIYIPLMYFAICSLACYPHVLMFDGVCITILGLNCAFLLDQYYHETCRAQLRNYGLKCTLMGIVFSFSHLLLMRFNSIFPEYLIIMETIAIAVLVYYSHLTHLTKEYLYARLIDVSSTRNKNGG